MNESADTSGDRKKRQSLVRAILFRIFAILLPLLLLESAARLYWGLVIYQPPTDDQIRGDELWHGAKSDDSIPEGFLKHDELLVAHTPTRTNNLALRGNEDIDPAVNYDGIRILCIGDSVTFGYSVSGNEFTYPAVLQRRLRAEGIDCQVINAGMPRFRVQHLVNLLARRLAILKPDFIVFLGGWNDARDNVLVLADREPNFMQRVHQNCYMFQVVKHWKLIPEVGKPPRAEARISKEGLDRFERSLDNMVAASRRIGATVALCTLPHFHANLETDWSQEQVFSFYQVGSIERISQLAESMNQRIADVAQRENTSLIDLSEIDAEELFADGVHPNDAGSKQIGKTVAEYLLQHLVHNDVRPE